MVLTRVRDGLGGSVWVWPLLALAAIATAGAAWGPVGGFAATAAAVSLVVGILIGSASHAPRETLPPPAETTEESSDDAEDHDEAPDRGGTASQHEHAEHALTSPPPNPGAVELAEVTTTSPQDAAIPHGRRTSLRGANMTRAQLRSADLRGADLRGADLSGANLQGANLNGALLNVDNG